VRSPIRFAAAAMLLHAALIMPCLARHHFDASWFIVAGDRFVTAGQTPTPVAIRPHSPGYDGQFYYRLALSPFATAPSAGGVVFDHPAWRAQRILLPLLVRALALGQPAAIPWAFLAANLAGIATIAGLAAALARRLSLPCMLPVALAFWPGWQIALLHDTTEILAAALLLAAISAYLGRRMALYAVLLALATLTRETAILAGGGIAAIEAWRWLRGPAPRAWPPLICAVLALVPFLAWRAVVAAWWGGAAQAHGMAHNAGWPVLGWLQATAANIANVAVGAAPAPHGRLMRIAWLACVGLTIAISVPAARAAWHGLRQQRAAGLALGWLLMLALALIFTANGPLIDATATFRALSEFWIVACVLACVNAAPAPARLPGALPWLLLAGGIGVMQLK
jgi:hypothetical protein